MSDYIKREDAMEPLYEEWKAAESRSDDDIAQIVKMDYITVSNVPSADVVEVRHGHWKVYKDLGYRFVKNYQCSECGDIIGDVNYNYCPNCGAKMDGEEE